MTLRRKMALHTGVMIVGVILIGVGTIWGVTGLRQDLGVALDANARLRSAYEVGFHLAAAKTWLKVESRSIPRATVALNAAAVKMDEHAGDDSTAMSPVRDAIRTAQEELNTSAVGAMQVIDLALADLAQYSADARQTIITRQQAADAKHRATLAFVIALSMGVVIVTILVGARQYRSVLRPLGRLAGVVRRMASGRLDQRLPRNGDAEFVQLADDFNNMAGQLDDLYRSLERRVAEKSKELVRSERLASVGYLAAGVAHEINNPLGIIAGYGERSLHHLKRGPMDAATAERVATALRVICDEAFRAKDITDRLLSLARPTTEVRRPVSIAELARDVVNTLTGLSKFADRRVVVKTEGEEADLTVIGSAGELKQVIVNLLVNAFEAAPGGEVQVEVTSEHRWVQLTITDNGRGMSTETLDRAFEPFFTERRSERPGTGLGLSIAHAIVADHSGSIRAESEGPNRGSRFIVRLPIDEEAVLFDIGEMVRSTPSPSDSPSTSG